jgi:hypothetical protein
MIREEHSIPFLVLSLDPSLGAFESDPVEVVLVTVPGVVRSEPLSSPV